MATFAGMIACAAELVHVNDPDPWIVTWGAVQDDTYNEQSQTNYQFDAFRQGWQAALDEQVTLTRVTCRFGGTPPAADVIYISTNPPAAGERGGASVPSNCALLVRKKTALGGRANQGRCYIPGVLPVAGVDDVGNIDPNQVSLLQGYADSWLALLTTPASGNPQSNMQVLHTPDPVTGSQLIPTPVIDLQVDSRIATQRRRLRK